MVARRPLPRPHVARWLSGAWRRGGRLRLMADTLLPRGDRYADVYGRFRWTIPSAYNIAVDVCDRHAGDRSRVALVYEDDAGAVSEHTFAEFRARSNQLARVLAGLQVERGDRVGIVLPQRPETAVAHLAAYKLGAVALPLSTLFGPEALEYRLRDAGAKVVVTDGENLERVLAVAKGLPALACVISVDRADAVGVVEYGRAIAREPDSLEPVATAAEDPDRKSTRLNSSHLGTSYAVFCLKKKKHA